MEHSIAYAGAGSPVAPPKQTAMQEHSARLHEQASQLSQCNERLQSLVSRVFGPEPQPAGGKDTAQAQPSGVLYVAQFGSERIALEIGRLMQSISKLEQVA